MANIKVIMEVMKQIGPLLQATLAITSQLTKRRGAEVAGQIDALTKQQIDELQTAVVRNAESIGVLAAGLKSTIKYLLVLGWASISIALLSLGLAVTSLLR